MIFKQLRAVALAAAAIAFAVSAVGQAPEIKSEADAKHGDYAGKSLFQVLAGNNNHTYALEQIAGTQVITGYPLYATEPGDDSIPDVLGFSMGDQKEPIVKLVLNSDRARNSTLTKADTVLPANSRGLITFQLIGATFREGVANSDLKFVDLSGYFDAAKADPAMAFKDNPIARMQKAAGGTLGSGGGSAGDSYVTFEVQVGAKPIGGGDSAGYAFLLSVPTLADVSPAGVKMMVTVDSASPDFPTFFKENRWKVTGKDATRVAVPEEQDPTVQVIPRTVDAIKVSFTSSDPSNIYLEGRQQLVQIPDPLKLTNLISLAGAGVSLLPGVLQNNGKPLTFTGAGAGHLVLDVKGISGSDTVFYNTMAPRGAIVPDVGETLTVSSGAANGAFALSSLSGDSGLYVYVDGKRILSPGVIAVSAKIEFSSGISDLMWSAGRPVPAPTMKGDVEVRYAGTEGELPRAFAIAPASSGDTSNVRVRCDSATPCQIYFACNDTMGGDVFGKVADMIAPRATMVFRDGGTGASDLRSVFDEGTWMSGRLACDVIAPGTSVEVQVLTRSGDTLVNNTYVEG